MAVSGPLNNVRILDLTHVWAGPLGVRFLADLGAQVVKVEAPTSRGPQVYPAEPIGGYLGGQAGHEPWNVNAVFNKLNRNRQSLCLDLKQADGHAVLLELIKVADVIIENFSARAMPAMGLAYDVLREVNPQIIYVSMPGYGSTGPYRDRVAFGPTVEPMSGLTTMLGYDANQPRNSAIALMDPIAATHAAAAVVEALRYRERVGHGAYVELSLHEGGVSYNGPWLLDEQLGNPPRCMGNAHPDITPHGVYPCAGDDEWLALACETNDQWRRLCAVVGDLDAALDRDARRAQQQNIDEKLAKWTFAHDKHSAAETLQAAGVPAGPVNTTPDLLADPQVQARNFFVPYERFNTPMPGNPVHMAGLDTSQWTPCPKLGEDNAAVLADWLGYSDAQTEALAQASVLWDRPPA